MQTSTSVGVGQGGQSSPAQPGRAFASTSVPVFRCDLGADGLPISRVRLTTSAGIRLCMAFVSLRSWFAVQFSLPCNPVHATPGATASRFAGRSANKTPPIRMKTTTSVKSLWTPRICVTRETRESAGLRRVPKYCRKTAANFPRAIRLRRGQTYCTRYGLSLNL